MTGRGVLKRTLQAIVAILLLGALAFLGRNALDEPLDRAALGRLDTPAEAALLDPANGGYALWAFDAPAGVDAVVLGKSVVNAYLGVPLEKVRLQQWGIRLPYVPAGFEFPPALACIDRASACVLTYLDHQNEVEALVAEKAYLLERLAAIGRAAQWSEIAPRVEPGAPPERITALVAAFSLSLAGASVAVARGNVDAGVARLEDDVRVARRLLEASRTLALKAAATGMLRRSMVAYSENLSARRAEPVALARLAASLERVASDLTPAERTLAPPVVDEARRVEALIGAIAHPALADDTPLAARLEVRAVPLAFAPGATMNRVSELFDLEGPLMDCTTPEYAAREAAVRAAYEARALALAQPGLGGFYNPLGKLFAGSVPPLTDFAAQLHDVEALMHAVRAKAHLLEARVPFDGAQAAIEAGAAGAAAWTDAYSGRPLQWSASEAAIVVAQRSSRPVTLVKVPLA